MKKNFLLAFVTLLLFSSCGNDENENTQNNTVQSFSGVWKMSKTMIISGLNKTTLQSSDIVGCEALNLFEFGQNQNFSIKYYSKNNNECITDGFDTGNYQYNENSKMLTFTYSDSLEKSVVIYSINDTEIMTVDRIEDYNNDGVNDTAVIVFKKQQ